MVWSLVCGICMQGAFMAALYAQGLAWGDMYKTVRKYAARMSSVHHLLLVSARLSTGIHQDCVLAADCVSSGVRVTCDIWQEYAASRCMPHILS